ncbi:MAG: hypothetical protein OK457_08280, partial [Thaumarchaeota archaeon]|nr:hypothetical protein [Nitrososphaerota archaeon]
FNDISLLSEFLGSHSSGPFDIQALKNYESKAKEFSNTVIESNDLAFRTFQELGRHPDSLEDHMKNLRKLGFLSDK